LQINWQNGGNSFREMYFYKIVNTEIKFVCSNCGQHIVVPQEAVGETVSCPTCGTETTVSAESATTPPKQKSHKFTTSWILFAVVGLFAVLIFLARFTSNTSRTSAGPETTAISQQPATNLVKSSNPPVMAKEIIPQPIPIEGLFGVKLGEPLPPSCKITSASETVGGFHAIIFIPPETNSVFDTYVVYLDATGRVVATINGQGKFYDDSSEFDRTRDVIIAKFRERYGKEELSGSEGMYSYSWKRGKRDVTLTEFMKLKHLDLSCTDKDLYDSVGKSKPPVDTRGL